MSDVGCGMSDVAGGSGPLSREWRAAVEGVLRELAALLAELPAGRGTGIAGQLLGLASGEGRPSDVEIDYPHQPRPAGVISPESLAEVAAANAEGVRVVARGGRVQTMPAVADPDRLAEGMYARLGFDDGRAGRV